MLRRIGSNPQEMDLTGNRGQRPVPRNEGGGNEAERETDAGERVDSSSPRWAADVSTPIAYGLVLRLTRTIKWLG